MQAPSARHQRHSGGAYVIQDDQRSVNTCNGIVANTRLDGSHPGVNEFGRHGCRVPDQLPKMDTGGGHEGRGKSEGRGAPDVGAK